MTRQDFDRILVEEGIDSAELRDDLWNTRPGDQLDENKLRSTAKQFKKNLHSLQARQALNRAIDREWHDGR